MYFETGLDASQIFRELLKLEMKDRVLNFNQTTEQNQQILTDLFLVVCNNHNFSNKAFATE